VRSATIDHAIVTDTDAMQQGGYALVAASPGVTPEERLVLGEASGVSDYLHHATEDRTYFSFLRITDRYAFVRRFTHGRRRNDSQNRVVAHTLLLGSAELDALEWLPWLIAEARFAIAGRQERFHLTKDAVGIPGDGVLPQLDFDVAVDSPADVHQRLQRRVAHIRSQLGEERTSELLAEGIATVAQRMHLMLPQGVAFEQLALVLWSLLPLADRRRIAWTQHLAPGMRHADFGIANAAEPRLMSDLYGGRNAWRLLDGSSAAVNAREFRDLVDRQLATSAERAHFVSETNRWGLGFSVDPDRVRRWSDWNRWIEPETAGSERAGGEASLETLAHALRDGQQDPWVDGKAVLRFALAYAARLAALHDDRAIARAVENLRAHSVLGNALATPLGVDGVDELSLEFDERFVLAFLTRAAAGTARERELCALAADVLMRRPVMSQENGALAISLVDRLRTLDPERAERLVQWLPRSADVMSGLIATLSEDASSLADLTRLYREAVDEKGRSRIADKALTIFRRGPVDARTVSDWLERLRPDKEHFLELLRCAPPEVTASALNALAKGSLDSEAAEIAERLLTTPPPKFYEMPSFGRLIAAFARRGRRTDLWFDQLVRCARAIDASGDGASVAELNTVVRKLAEETLALPPQSVMSKSLAISLGNAVSTSDGCLRAAVSLGGARLMADSRFCDDVRGYWLRSPARMIDWCGIAAEMMRLSQPHDAAYAARDWWMSLPIEQLSRSQPMYTGLDRVMKEDAVKVVARWSPIVARMSLGTVFDEFLARLRSLAATAGAGEPALWLRIMWREWRLGRTPAASVLAAADDPKNVALIAVYDDFFASEFSALPQRVRVLLEISREGLLPTTRKLMIDRLCTALMALRIDEWEQFREPAEWSDLLREWRVRATCARVLARHPHSGALRRFISAAVEASAFDALAVLQQEARNEPVIKKGLQPARSQHGAFLWLGGVAE
jgi:hypothetical protein